MIKKILTSILVIVSMLTLYAPVANACSCGGGIDVSPRVVRMFSAAVFVGKVEGARVGGPFVTGSSEITFEVSKVWKGGEADTFVIRQTGSSCEYGFKSGHEYLVYANRRGDDLYVGSCGDTKLFSGAQEDISDLNRGGVPVFEVASLFFNAFFRLS